MALTRARRLQVTGHETIRPSVQYFLETGDRNRMKSDNAWMLVGFPFAEVRAAYRAGDHVQVRRLLAALPARPGFLLK